MPLDKLNYINIHSSGTFGPEVGFHTTPADVDAIFTHLQKNVPARIALYFHGGLNDEDSGRESIEWFIENYHKNNVHAIGIIWETGLWTSLRQVLTEDVLNLEIAQKLIRYIGNILARKYNVPLLSTNDHGIVDEVSTADFFHQVEQAIILDRSKHDQGLIAAPQSPDEQELKKIAEELVDEANLTEEERKWIDSRLRELNEEGNIVGIVAIPWGLIWNSVRITARTIQRLWDNKDHGLHATIVEEVCREFGFADLGSKVWDVMKGQAEIMWRQHEGNDPQSMHPGRYLFERLQEYFVVNNNVTLEVIGHSAGSIALCEALRVLHKTDSLGNVRINTISFLAPAVNIKLFSKTVFEYRDKGLYRSLRIFTMRDADEREDNVIPIPVITYLYPSSLLYVISGILEGKDECDAAILGMERHMNRAQEKVRTFLKDPNKVAFSNDKDYPEGWISTAIKHGDFDNNIEIVDSIKHFWQE